MAEFINTIDVLGDDVVMDSIIERTITEFKDDKITKIGQYAFYGCTNLVAVSLPLVEDLNSNGTIFSGCTSLESLEIPNLKYIRNAEFKDLKALKSVSFPNAVLGTEINPGMGAFQNCSTLASAYIPKLPYIPNYMFFGTALTFADFPKVTSIYEWSFANTPLKVLILRNTETMCGLVGTACFNGTPIKSGAGYIYVPRSLIEDYKAATNWSVYADQFRALEDYTVDGTTTGELDETKI